MNAVEISVLYTERKNKQLNAMKKPTVMKRKVLLFFIDFLIFAFVYLAMLLYAKLSNYSLTTFQTFTIILTIVVSFAARFALSSYSSIWRYANAASYLSLIIADAVGMLSSYFLSYLAYALARTANNNLDFGDRPRIIFIVAFTGVELMITVTSRFVYQYITTILTKQASPKDAANKIGVAIIGAGQIGSLVATELMYKGGSHYRPVCFVDNNPDKAGQTLLGLRVLYGDDGIIETLKRLPVQEVFIALPELSAEKAEHFHKLYSPHFKVKIYDYPMRDDMSDASDKKVLREIRIEDLLFRRTLDITTTAASHYYKNKVVLVTGGGGSIGSEICRQIAKCSPKQLVILDIYENNAYEIEQHLIRRHGDRLNLAVEIASVRDRARLEAIFAHYKPQVVFHAAAHKHVPLMEHSSCEAIKNNVMGTYNTADMAEKYGTEKFVLISTDKAVNPTNIMGASKRMCEMVIQCRTNSKTAFSAVRFGNVLGSNGSVIPLFKRQIAGGGPVTITDKRIIRYFMTIPEASQLVIQAGAMAKKGELFVLNMGKPVKIIDLAENMIRLSGLTPYIDIDIVEIGLRPGEKLYEELLIQSETLTKTDNDLIFIEKDTPFTREQIEERIAMLKDAVAKDEGGLCTDRIKQAMKRAVPTYKDPEQVNKKALSSKEMHDADAPDDTQENEDA